jgi:hypothetical protein
MPFTQITASPIVIGAQATATLLLGGGILEAASVFVESPLVKVANSYVEIGIMRDPDDANSRLICLAAGYCTPSRPISWTGLITLDSDVHFYLRARGVQFQLFRGTIKTR